MTTPKTSTLHFLLLVTTISMGLGSTSLFELTTSESSDKVRNLNLLLSEHFLIELTQCDITSILDKIRSYKSDWIQNVNRMPRSRLLNWQNMHQEA
jgi:hypothetical protein